MDRGESFGLTLAVVGHAALFGLLSLGFLANANTPKIEVTPIEVALVEDVGLESTSPNPTTEEPAAKLSPVEAPIEPESAPPEPVEESQPEAKPQPAPPKPAPAPAAKPVPKPPAKPTSSAPPSKPTTPRNTAPTGRLDGIVNGLTDKPSTSKSTTPPAKTAGPEVRASLIAELSRKLRPHWRSPTGADIDKLRTVVRVQLDESGRIVSMGECQQKGTVTDSNRPQVALHCENAKRAIRLAAPFSSFPTEYYNVWKVIFPAFDRNLK
ncbi:cell envelope biogenesis protein TolA [Sphingomonas sp.]|jgi:outer membrane biosynthesis protein TonB|uniref:cell envelope biogenesis protein TolA n=1 Tax=Sphingomonas sp. TaxID=28214 RepID=UPI002ED9AA75